MDLVRRDELDDLKAELLALRQEIDALKGQLNDSSTT
jgi:BMFP domain-containing protein YqiC